MLCTLDMECKQRAWNKEYIIDYGEIRLFWSFLFQVLAFSFPFNSLPAFITSQLDLFSFLCHMVYDLHNFKKRNAGFCPYYILLVTGLAAFLLLVWIFNLLKAACSVTLRLYSKSKLVYTLREQVFNFSNPQITYKHKYKINITIIMFNCSSIVPLLDLVL